MPACAMMARHQQADDPPDSSREDTRARLKLSCHHQTVTTRIGQSREWSWLSQLVDENKESVWKSLTDERLVAEGEALFESADQATSKGMESYTSLAFRWPF